MLIEYRFFINDHPVNPHYSGDLKKEYELEAGQRFYRAQLSSELTFIKDDFDWLDAQAFDTEFVLVIKRSGPVPYWRGVFYKTDGDWDEDNKKIKVKPDLKDSYNDVLAGMDKEYNLIKLAPAKTELEIQKRPLIQAYIPGGSVVSCFLGGNGWEQDVAFEEDNTSDLINTYYFSLASTLYKIQVAGAGTPTACKGDYVSEILTDFYGKNQVYNIERVSKDFYVFINGADDKTSVDYGSIWEDSNTNQWVLIAAEGSSNATLRQYGHSSSPPSSGSLTHISGAVHTTAISYTSLGLSQTNYYYEMVEQSSGDLVYSSIDIGYTAAAPIADTDTLDFRSAIDSGIFTGTFLVTEVYMRYLLDVEEIAGLSTNDIPADDIVVYNRNYKKVIGYAIDQSTITANTTTSPTEYGLAEDGEYFLEPPGFPTYYKYYPMARSTWGLSSIWFNFDLMDWTLETKGRKPYISKDSSMISDAISVLLAEIAPSISHDGTSTYSEFLYGTVNPITANAFRVMLTQKSNITTGEYDKPAQKAPITLNKILTMLRDTFQCYWYIEDSKLKIEQVKWFKNGGAYSGSPSYTADLTVLTDPKNQKKWGFVTNKYNFDKEDLAERIEFHWMDDVTLGFEGFPIEINSKFILPGKIDEVNVGGFTTDVDYMLLNPTAINQDGFALFAAIFDDTNLFDNTDVDIELGKGVNPATGATFVDATHNTTGFIPVVPGTYYTRSYRRNLAFYDYSKVFTEGITEAEDLGTIQVPEGSFYVRCDVYTGAWASYRFVKGKTLSGMYVLPFLERTVDNADLRLQNGLMSWIYLHPNYWVYDLPSDDIDINGIADTAQGVKRTKKQIVFYPSTTDPDPLKLVKTYIGDGQIEKLSVNLSSRMNEIQLKYDTE
jgi:hypothetical protein